MHSVTSQAANVGSFAANFGSSATQSAEGSAEESVDPEGNLSAPYRFC